MTPSCLRCEKVSSELKRIDMIPKTIHLCWISGDPYPPKVKRCIDSWKDENGNGVLKDYRIVVWDYDKVMSLGYKWIRQAVEEKKYAFAADCVRFYALYHYGGIYLDSDVEMLKPFDDLLDLPYFMCAENEAHRFEAAVIGAEPGQQWIKECLDYYKGRSFVNAFGDYRQAVLPYVMEQRLKRKYELRLVNGLGDFDHSPKVVCYLPSDYFCPKSWTTKQITITDNTYCIHHFEGEWLKTKGSSDHVGAFTKLLKRLKTMASYVKHKIFHL